MAKSLILVESRQKLQTLQSYLNDNEKIVNINGAVEDGGAEYLQHLLFNNPSEISFLSESKIRTLSRLIKKSESVFVATSPDFAGDAVAHQLYNSLDLGDNHIHRLSLEKLSKNELLRSLGKKQSMAKVRGQLLEQSLQVDSTFDYYCRDVFNKKRAKRPILGLAAALALKKICEQETTAQQRTQNQDIYIQAIFRFKNTTIPARLIKVNGKPVSIANSHIAKAVIFDLKEYKIKISSVSDKSFSNEPPLPLTTAKLIAVAENKLGFSPRKTLATARSLYNGCDVGLKNPVGLITNPVTDSLFIPEQDLLAAREFILINYGKAYVPENPRLYSELKDTVFNVIRPTLVTRSPKKMKKYLADGQFLLYDIIWRRFLASQMTDSTFVRRKIDLTAGPKKRYLFRAEQNQTTNRGYLQIFPEAKNVSSYLFSQEFPKNAELVPHNFDIKIEKSTPGFYYTEGRLLQALGDSDVCLVETLEYIPDILKEWKFIRQTEDGKLFPTRLGKNACDALGRRYPDIMNEQFVRRYKKKLFHMLERKKKSADPVTELLKLLQNEARSQYDETAGIEVKKIKGKCPICNGAMLKQISSSGEFIMCEHYPDTCQYSKAIHTHAHRYYGRCDECDAELTVKVGRYGRFLACSKFPKCNFTKPFPTGAKCPKEGCEGDVIERTTKSGRLFYGCSFFPKCKFSSWQFPVNIACPRCGNPYMTSKSGADFEEYHCPQCKTNFDLNLVEK